ncbi:DinB family protein [Vibrio rumoiensis]|uniref:DinB-like domain-containing protein n=1 Tax=Vibrio rumoiensis 1S-45 TaxID=1188252 RepID=A0A1E5E6V5_9VIBR|nr:DinB family protein [Vibrio rumoiensis]OEF30028.1 hypothetical protein A1QC_03295 [Vibrio rumoiensis 1S-45]
MSLQTSSINIAKPHGIAHPMLKGNLEGIEQAITLLERLNDEQYIYVASPYVQSSIGSHLRHIIDMYFSLMGHTKHQDLVNYDQRRRGAQVETCRETGLQELQLIKTWLLCLSKDELQATLTIQSETSIYQQHVCEITSSLQRELLFVSSHTTHHFAVMRVTAVVCNIETDGIFSYAPATASYLRSLG